MKLSVDQDDVFCVTYGQEMQFSSKFHVIVPAFWWLMMCPPITKVSETSLPSFSADALMHDHWKGSRLSHNLDWSLAQQHISVQFTSIHSFAGINDAQNKNMELFFQCFFPLHNEIRHLPWFHFICRNDCFSVCSIGTHDCFKQFQALDLLCDKWQIV